MKTLTLPLKSLYFNQIKSGQKVEEYRQRTPYWRKRLEGAQYDQIVLTLGYPARNDHARRLVRPWRGYEIKTIEHSLFGDKPTEVFAIKVN